MQIKDLINAFPSFQKLSSQDIGISTLHKLAVMFDKLDVHFRFFQNERNKLVEKYCSVKDGKIYPKNLIAGQEFDKECTELLNLDIDVKEINLPVIIPETENIKLSYSDLENLKEFIRIGGKNED